MELWRPSDLEWVCCYGQGHQEETPGPKSGEAKSPEATEQNGEEAHRAEGLREKISLSDLGSIDV